MQHRPALFTGPGAKLRGVILSGIACLALAAYAVLPGGTSASWAAVYAQSAAKSTTSKVSGKFTSNGKKPLKGQPVTVTFKDKDGDVIKTVKVKLDGKGQFKVNAPKGAAKVSVSSNKSGVKVSQTFAIKKGQDVSVTAVLPPKGSGLLPGIFPY
jgi:hypothetical protein